MRYYRRYIITSFTILLIFFSFFGCSLFEHKVDSFDKWAEDVLRSLDGNEKSHFISSIDRDKIRKDFVSKLNSTVMKDMGDRTDKMIWMEGKDLHMYNRSGFFEIEPDVVISQHRNGIKDFVEDNLNKEDKNYRYNTVIFGAMFTFFDNVIIHSLKINKYGLALEEGTITVIPTNRRDYYTKMGPFGKRISRQTDF